MRFNFANIRAVIKPVRGGAVILFIVMLLAALFDMLGIGLVMPLFDLLLSEDRSRNILIQLVRQLGLSPSWDLAVIGMLTLGAFSAKFLFVVLRAYKAADFVSALRQFWTAKIFENFIHAEYLKISRMKQGELSNVMVQEPVFASKGINDIVDIWVNTLIAVSMVAVMAWADWRLTGAALVLLVLSAGSLWSVSNRHSMTVGKQRINQSQEISQIVIESINGCRQIKVFSLEYRASRELGERLQKLMDSLRRFALTNALPQAFSEWFIVSLFVGGLLIQSYFFSELDLKGLVAKASLFALAGMRLFNSASTIFAKRMAVITYWPSISLVHGMAQGVNEVTRKPEVVEVAHLAPVRKLSFAGVDFAYDVSNPLFVGLNLDFAEGLYALAGRSGSGKSTLCDMVAKLYNPQQGKILAGKVDIAEIAPEDWRRRLGYVSQDNFMFHATVAENIRVGRSGASMDDVRKAAAMADAAEFIERLPDGYDTVIGHGGIALSGGQRQRISIARALIRRPEIIIFDEATSALDAESEYRILEHLKKLAANCIVLVTTHRLKTLRIADKIFWFNSGRLQESGSFDELMNAGGEFASVIQSGEVV